jgi:ribitol 2-dehydrogenase
MNLKDKVIIITGASTGIGREAAITLVKKGMKVVLAARSAEKLHQLVKENGNNVLAVPCDITKQHEVEILVENALTRFGKIDVLFANAGVFIGGNILDGDLDYFEKGLQTNLMGTLRVIQAVVPHIKKQKGGHVIITTSVAGHRYVPGQAVYCASKHAQYLIARGLRNELLEHNIKVTTIAPGWVVSEFWEHNPDMLKAAREAKNEGMAIETKNIADGVVYALEQPDNVNIGDVIIQPVKQEH